MANNPKVINIEEARQCVEQAREMQERARLMWSKARKSLEETQSMRASLYKQIEDLAQRDTFRRQLMTSLLSKILDAAIDGTGAHMGNIQLLDPKTGRLKIHVERGFDSPFLEFFNSVHVGQAACGTALKNAKRVIVPDVADSPIFSRTDCLEAMLDAGARAVQSTPIVGKSGRVWGMLSTHYRNVNEPRKRDLRLIDYLADRAAEILEEECRAEHPGDGASTTAGTEIATATLTLEA